MDGFIELDVGIEQLEDRIAPSAPSAILCTPGAILITPGSGAEILPPTAVSLEVPPPLIFFFGSDGPVRLGFHSL